MTSILTNASAMAALQSLNSTVRQLSDTQNHISTGMRVAAASDNPAYWSIAVSMRSDNSALSAVKDALGLGTATVDVAASAMNSAVKIVDLIKAKLVAAREPGLDRSKIQSEITQLQQQLQSIADSASFSGENWLSQDSGAANYSANKSFVASFFRNSGTIQVQTVDIDTSALKFYDINDQSGIFDKARTQNLTTISVTAMDISVLTDSVADQQTLSDYISVADAAFGDLTQATSTLGAVKQRISVQQDFVTSLMDSITRGIGQLVDADMSKESTLLQALQTQQQLGIQALSIANSNTQLVLKLFGG